MVAVTIDVRTLDPTIGTPPAVAKVSFARVTPSSSGGTLTATDTTLVTLTDGHGAINLAALTVYRVRTYGFTGFGTFTIRTGSSDTTLADLWQTGQVDPGDYTTVPVPQTLEDLLAAVPAAYDGGVTY